MNGEVIVLDSAGYGPVTITADASIQLDHVRSEHNQNGGFYIAPTAGSSKVTATVVDSVFAYNGANVIWVDTVGGALTQVQIERSLMSHNGSMAS